MTDGSFITYVNVSIQVRNNPNPSIQDIDFTTNTCNSLSFVSTDFSSVFSDPDSDPMDRIRIDAVPSSGVLAFKGVAVSLNDEILASEINQLSYTNSIPGTYSFDWSARDNQGYWSQTTETATMNVEGVLANQSQLTSSTTTTATVIDNTINVVSSSTYSAASVTIDFGYISTDLLAGTATLPAGATESYTGGVLTLTGTNLTAAEIQTWFRGVTYTSASTSQKRTFDFQVGLLVESGKAESVLKSITPPSASLP